MDVTTFLLVILPMFSFTYSFPHVRDEILVKYLVQRREKWIHAFPKGISAKIVALTEIQTGLALFTDNVIVQVTTHLFLLIFFFSC